MDDGVYGWRDVRDEDAGAWLDLIVRGDDEGVDAVVV